jgi:uncharacterized SAM-dependent methyltransferase
VPIVEIAQVVSFDKDETIHTESSHKYSVDEVRDLGSQAGLVLRRSWFDARRWFLLALFRPI